MGGCLSFYLPLLAGSNRKEGCGDDRHWDYFDRNKHYYPCYSFNDTVVEAIGVLDRALWCSLQAQIKNSPIWTGSPFGWVVLTNQKGNRPCGLRFLTLILSFEAHLFNANWNLLTMRINQLSSNQIRVAAGFSGGPDPFNGIFIDRSILWMRSGTDNHPKVYLNK